MKKFHLTHKLRTILKTEHSQASSASDASALFVLIIGINTYASSRLVQLRGPTTDAKAFADYFRDPLGVPESQIQVLLNEQASRAAIIKAFIALRDDVRIKKGDPIFIFYAGHGGEAEAPAGWEAGGTGAKIQMLMPQDFSDEPGKEVPGIPDYTVAALLNQIAKEKGDNITVVFDSCHSASASRGGPSNDIICRSANLPAGYAMPISADRDIWGTTGTRGGGVHPEFKHLGLRSYVLLSACQSFESAQESGGHGFFSTSLLTLFRTIGPDKLRYAEIITRMDVIPNQNPQCEGLHKDRYIFNRKVAAPNQKIYTIRPSPVDPTKLVMDGGLVHGLSIGAEFSVFAQKDLKSQQLGNLRLDVLQPFNSIMAFTKKQQSFNLAPMQTAYALQTKPGVKEALRLYIDPASDKAFKDLLILNGSGLENPLWQHVRLIDSVPNDAHIVLSMENDMIILTDPNIERYGKRTRIENIDPDPRNVAKTLQGLAHYFWNLERGDNVSQLVKNLTLEFFKLGKSENMNNQLSPVGQNLYQSNVVELPVSDDDDDVYGIRLTNNTGRNLFPNLFYFDNSDFSIEPYYTSPPTPAKSTQEAPLKKDGTLTLGYGSGGCAPWSYYLREGEDIDAGFLKLFVSTEAVDLSNIPQPSPLESSRGVAQRRVIHERLWGTLVIPVIQRRSTTADPDQL